MRSRLLLSVARLPTIRESWEEVLPGGPGQGFLASPSREDCMTSTRQQAQPTKAPNETAARARPSVPHWPGRIFKKSCPTKSQQDSTACFSGQQPLLPGASTADPLDWLLGPSQEKKLSRTDLPRRTGPSADHRGPHRQMESSKVQGAPRGKLCDAREPGQCLERPLKDWHHGSRASLPRIRATASLPSSRPSSVLRTLYLHLPVIHEL